MKLSFNLKNLGKSINYYFKLKPVFIISYSLHKPQL